PAASTMPSLLDRLCLSLVYPSMLRPPPTSTLFPYTTLFRSGRRSRDLSLWSLRKEGTHAAARPRRRFRHEHPPRFARAHRGPSRSEEHTSELQSRENLVCRLLLEKKKHKQHNGWRKERATTD